MSEKKPNQKKAGWFGRFIKRHRKYGPLLFFIGGFIWDSLTLGRIDRMYDRIVLCTYLISLTVSILLYSLAGDGKWKKSFFARYKKYFPLANQFFLGGLSSAYVIYFSRSASLSKAAAFFIILVILFFANELLKKRLSNKYMLFSAYFFVNFTFLSFFIPVLIKQMNTTVFLVSGSISLMITLILVIVIFALSPSTRKEIQIGKMLGIIFSIYGMINIFYFFNLIPPVPLALETGIVAHNIEVKDNKYIVQYENDEWYKFWRENKYQYTYIPGENVYVFSSVFAPTNLEKGILHRWKWFSPQTRKWEFVEDISFEITGGRDFGYRGYSYKSNMKDGEWQVEVITEEGLVLGVLDFEIINNSAKKPKRLSESIF